jgi:hypothetical protein
MLDEFSLTSWPGSSRDTFPQASGADAMTLRRGDHD